jgi:hypothetical protein
MKIITFSLFIYTYDKVNSSGNGLERSRSVPVANFRIVIPVE